AALALINLLRDPNASIQGEAAEMLGHLDDERAITPLTELLEHRNVELALRAAEAMGRLGDQSGLQVAVRFLRSDHEHTPLAARAFGTILNERFRPGERGVTEARLFLKRRKWTRDWSRGLRRHQSQVP
ncbi:MAG: HEAT repeat domain-containing protein, partial [Planctomycetes bacterium]|nr:HEAT repeat domain-containing protein [Planctomycetota bacterium]